MVDETKVKGAEVKDRKSKKDWFKITKRVSLPVNKAKVDVNFIPKDIGFEDNKKVLEQVGIGIAYKTPILLIGETGTGKTSMIRHIAHSTHNGFVRVNFNGGTTVEDLVGRWVLEGGNTKWVDGLLIMAMKKGYYFHADEINAASPEINFVIHSLLDDDGFIVLAEKGDEVVIPHSNFRFFAAMNPPQEYAGAKDLNKALLSRFMVIKVDFPSPKVEQKILMNRTGVDEDVAERMVRCAGEIRVMHQEDVSYVFSTRDLIQWATMYKVYKKYLPSAEMTVLNKIGDEDVEAIKDIMTLSFKSLDDQGVPPEAQAGFDLGEEEVA